MAAMEGQCYPSDAEIKQMMLQKATELFEVCDKEKKGFINKRDMQRLQDELPLSSEALESVFDSLDDDGNGFLTLEEFTDGFGSFVGLANAVEKHESASSSHGSDKVYENEDMEMYDDQEGFNGLIDHIGAQGVFDDQDIIRSLWNRIRRDEPELLGNFEEFLCRVTGEIKRSHLDLNNLETALRTKSVAHDEEVRKLYDEMELQIRQEKDRILAEERAKERAMRDEMEQELQEKEKQLHEIIYRHTELEDRLSDLTSHETETKIENDKLLRDKEELESLLDHTQRHLDESKLYINSLRQKHREEKRERAMAALQISEGIALERESLVKQLDMLRDVNKKLRDERDEVETRRILSHWEGPSLHSEMAQVNQSPLIPSNPGPKFPYTSLPGHLNRKSIDENAIMEEGGDNSRMHNGTGPGGDETDSPNVSARSRRLTKQGSVLGNYFGSLPSEEDCEWEELANSAYNMPVNHAHMVRRNNMMNSHSLHHELLFNPYSSSMSLEDDVIDEDEDESTSQSMPTSARGQPVGAHNAEPYQEAKPLAPERVFKVVFVGDSGVGKSSFIYRFCNDEFKATFSATIGVDFQVRSLMVDQHMVALQLWDTAGQERFRSITKQYFRKADGVLIMYDVTSEASFVNVRNWMDSVHDGVDEGTVLLMFGNKADLLDDEHERAVSTKDGEKLSETNSTLFYEGSAKSGLNVVEAMTAMSSLLREKEDRAMENALKVAEGENKKKTGCCK